MRERILYQFLLEADNESGRLRNMLHIGQNVKKSSVVNAALKIVLDIVTKIIYVLLFMYIPYRILSTISVWEGFQLRQSIVYFTVFLSCICGSLINSGMFEVDEDAHSLLVTMHVEPSLFFKERMIYKLLVDGLGFGIAYCLIGLDFGHAFYLMVWVLISRLVGELINLYVFRYTGKMISELTIVTIAIMGTCVFMTYGFSFLRNRVVDFTGYIYNYVWLMAALILAAVALYALFNYAGYGYIAGRYIERLKLRDGEIDTAESRYGDMLLNEYSKHGYFHIYDKDRKRGLEYLHKVFFKRNFDYIRNTIAARSILIVIACVGACVVCRMSQQDTRNTIWNVMCNAMPIMVFIMYCLSVTPKLCKTMFCYIDHDILQSGSYVGKRYNFLNYVVRLKMMTVCEVFQAIVLCAAFIIAGVASGNAKNLAEIVPVCVGIILLAVFYAVFNLLVYYVCQPYNSELKAKGYTFFAAHAGMLAICYGCVYVSCTALVFDMALAVVLAVMLSLSATLVYHFSNITFKVR